MMSIRRLVVAIAVIAAGPLVAPMPSSARILEWIMDATGARQLEPTGRPRNIYLHHHQRDWSHYQSPGLLLLHSSVLRERNPPQRICWPDLRKRKLRAQLNSTVKPCARRAFLTTRSVARQ